MNKRQKIVQQAFLDDEEKVIKRLKTVYNQSLKDITAKSKALQEDIEKLDTLAKLSIDDEEKEKILSQRRSKVYQKQYQDSLKKQVSDVLDKMQESEFKTVSAYLDKCYEQGFLGTMYDLQGQGIPLCFPLDQEAMVRAVQLDSKISKGLYSRLGEDVSLLKKKITAQVSRGISTGMTFPQIAQQLAGVTNIGFNNAVRIARTEGHRIQCQSGMDACYKAKEKGADVVKQWDSTLDGATRSSHVQVDGEIKELDEKFSNGLRFPSDPHGAAAEVINCRCALLQRAKWALDNDELETLKQRAEYFGLDKAETFEDYKKKYLKAEKQITKTDDFIADIAKKHGISIDISAAGGLVEEATAQIQALDELLTEYNSTIVDYRIVKGGFFAKDGGQCYMKNGKSAVSVKAQTIKRNNIQDTLKTGDNSYLVTTYHEFAHSLSQSREKIDPEFWQDLKKVRTKYRKALKEIDKAEIVDHTISTTDAIKARNKIFISDYANSDIDEFLAEAFAQCKLSKSPSPYAKEVVGVVDKYFKKKSTLTNASKSGIVKMSNKEVRQWYLENVSKIVDSIDDALPIEEKARKAFEARNKIRTEARNKMADEKTMALLDAEKPNKTFEELIESKMKRKGMTREEAIEDIYKTATKTNADINKELGLDGD